jgi:hypothetical protein
MTILDLVARSQTRVRDAMHFESRRAARVLSAAIVATAIDQPEHAGRSDALDRRQPRQANSQVHASFPNLAREPLAHALNPSPRPLDARGPPIEERETVPDLQRRSRIEAERRSSSSSPGMIGEREGVKACPARRTSLCRAGTTLQARR